MTSTRPTILCLANSAAYSRTFFEELQPHLESRGFDVVFALDSHLSDILYANGKALPDAWYFTDFCASQTPPSETELKRDDLRWSLLLSDFDRLLTIDIPVPLANSERLAYAHVPLLLERFFTDIFDAVGPVAVLYEQASNSFALAANEIAKARDVPFFSLAPARVTGRVEISPTGALRDYVAVHRIWEKVKRRGGSAEARAVAENYIRTVEEQVPDYMRVGGDGEILARTGLWSKYANLGKLRHIQRILTYRRKYRDELSLNYQFGDPLVISWSLFRRSWRRRMRVRHVSKLYREAPSGGPYFLYPLHFHPEASTSVLAPDFIDELSVIKAIAFRLPAHVKLLVKEHPSAVALQPLDFYRQLDALPNVELIGPGANAKHLARDAIGVICVTSTLGFEAAALNKPVVCLGDVLYGYFPNVRMITHYGDLRSAIDWAMNYTAIDPDEIMTAMTAYVEFTDKGSFSFTGSLGDSAALENLAKIIAGRLTGRRSIMNTNHPRQLDE